MIYFDNKQSINLFSHKIKSIDEIVRIVGNFPRKDKVIMCHGTFDIVHPGHIRHLFYAKTKGKILVASLTCDEHISKGDMRPYVPEQLRAMNLAALEMIDYVIIDNEATPITNLQKLKPEFFAKGYEYNSANISIKTQQEIDTIDGYGGSIIFTPGDIVYSSSALLNLSPPSIEIDKILLLMNAEGVTFNYLKETVKKLKNYSVHVVGDLIIDGFTYCSMLGGMTKTPTMSLKYEEEKYFVGGAGIVAKHLKATGASVTFSTVVGNDKLKEFAINNLKQDNINTLEIIDNTKPTTFKNAFIVKNQRLLKVDTVDNRPITKEIEFKICSQINSTKTDAIIFSDFRHGIFNRSNVKILCESINNNVFKVADSQVASRWGNILDFKNFDLITPNEREARFSLGDQDTVIRPLAKELYKQAKCKTLILKCGERGLITYRSKKEGDLRAFFSIDSLASKVIDPVGSGDALLAYSTLSMLHSKNELVSSLLGLIAASIECEFDGNVPVTPELVLEKINFLEKISGYN